MVIADRETSAPTTGSLLGEAQPSPAGPIEPGSMPLRHPPPIGGPPLVQAVRFNMRPLPFMFGAARRLGETFMFGVPGRESAFVLSSHPDHVRSLFTAPYAVVPSVTADSPLRPIVGESVLTLNGDRHMRRRKLLLPPFHGEAIARYEAMIEELIEREIRTWPVGEPFPLARRMQAVTLDVIMSGIFGVDGLPPKGSSERRLRDTTRRLTRLSETKGFALSELLHLGSTEARGVLRFFLEMLRRSYQAVIEERRRVPVDQRGHDILSLLLEARDENGEKLSDQEVRDELITLVLAGHETTANSLAWAFERLTRFPAAMATLTDVVRRDDRDAGAYVEATVHEAMRVRPVIALVGRLVQKDWQLGEYVVPAQTPVAAAIALLHHRQDVYPDPFAFRPERFLHVKPGTYTWIPFGGGTRRCLGASLALAEQRIVLRAIARHVDLEAPDPAPERAQHRNVTLIPRHGGRVVVRRIVA